MGAGNITVRLNLNATGYSSGITAAQRQMRQLQTSSIAAGHATVSSMQASSAAIRVLEGGMTGNIRAAERFIGMLPGVGSALKAAFPLVGGIALAGVFVRIGEEAYNFIQKMKEIPPNPFDGLIASAKLSNDQLAISNDRLAMEIAKLEHKPVNGMALALDQARESSDKLFESLTKANAAFTEAMGKSNIGAIKGLWNNMAPTEAANRDIAGARAGVQAVTADHQGTIDSALASGNQANVAQAREALMVDLQTAYAKQDARLRAGLAAAQAKQAEFKGAYAVGSDQSKVIEKYQAAIAQSANEQSEVGGNYGQSIMQPRKDQLDAAKANQEAARQAQEAIVAQWRKDLDEQKADRDMTIAQEGQFWVQRMESARKGSLSYMTALDEANKDIAHERAENMRDRKELERTTAASLLPSAMDKSQGDAGELGSQGRAAADYLKNLNEGISLQHRNADAIAEASLRMAVMTGQISRYDAALAAAALHTQQYADAQRSLGDAIAHAQQLPEGLDKKATIAALNNQGTAMAGQRDLQVAQDQQSIAGAQIGPAMHQALDLMVTDWKDMATHIARTMAEGVDSLNNNIVKAMTGHGKASDFGATLSQAGSGLLKTGLQGIEGKLLGGLGFGKVDGSSATAALWVRMSTGVGGAAAGGLGGILSHIPGVGSVMKGGVGNFLMGLLPHFANGGDVAAGRPIMVGERGPEPFVPQVAGTIIPHGSMGGGGGVTNHYYTINAPGATDPAAIEAGVRRALPHAVAASLQAEHQKDKRTPRRGR